MLGRTLKMRGGGGQVGCKSVSWTNEKGAEMEGLVSQQGFSSSMARKPVATECGHCCFIHSFIVQASHP